MTSEADFLLTALQTNVQTMKAITLFIKSPCAKDDLPEALMDMEFISESTGDLLSEAFDPLRNHESMGVNPRLPMRRGEILTPGEVLEAFQTSLDLLTMEASVLLSKNMKDADEKEYDKIKKRTDHVISLIGVYARLYKRHIQSQHPGLWSAVMEKQFEKYLKIKPPR